jgi:hypothetical protein
MRLLAHSEVPTDLPFFHLAYLAAADMHYQYRQTPGVALLMACLILCYLLQKKAKWIIAMVTVPLLGLALVLMLVPVSVPGGHPTMDTVMRMSEIDSIVRRRLQQGLPIPLDAAKLGVRNPRDGWSTKFRMEKKHEQGCGFYEIRSAGRDRKFNTDDDRVDDISIRQDSPQSHL